MSIFAWFEERRAEKYRVVFAQARRGCKTLSSMLIRDVKEFMSLKPRIRLCKYDSPFYTCYTEEGRYGPVFGIGPDPAGAYRAWREKTIYAYFGWNGR